MKFSYLIPSTPEMSALTWMLRVWQSEFPQGASIDTVARRCVEQSAAAFGEPVKGMKNDEYQRVYMLSIELANFGLLFAPAPRAPPCLPSRSPLVRIRETRARSPRDRRARICPHASGSNAFDSPNRLRALHLPPAASGKALPANLRSVRPGAVSFLA